MEPLLTLDDILSCTLDLLFLILRKIKKNLSFMFFIEKFFMRTIKRTITNWIRQKTLDIYSNYFFNCACADDIGKIPL